MWAAFGIRTIIFICLFHVITANEPANGDTAFSTNYVCGIGAHLVTVVGSDGGQLTQCQPDIEITHEADAQASPNVAVDKSVSGLPFVNNVPEATAPTSKSSECIDALKLCNASSSNTCTQDTLKASVCNQSSRSAHDIGGGGSDTNQTQVESCIQASADAHDSCSSNGSAATIGKTIAGAGSFLSASTFDPKSMCDSQSRQAMAAFLGSAVASSTCITSVESCISECTFPYSPTDKAACDSDKTIWGYECKMHNLRDKAPALYKTDLKADYEQALQDYNKQVSTITSKLRSCQTARNTTMAGALTNSMQLLAVKANAAACERQFTQPKVACAPNDPATVNNPLCAAAYCPAHPGSPLPQCGVASGCDLNNPNAASNPACPQYCQFNPTAATCAKGNNTPPQQPNRNGATPVVTTGGNDTGDYAPGTGDITNGGQFTGYKPTGAGGGGAGQGNDSPGGGGGSLGGGGGGGGGGLGGGAGGGSAGAALKDIDHGLTSGSGSAGYGSSSVGFEGGGGRGGGAGNGSANNNGLDLSKFLPGGANDPARGLASANAQSLGITGANDLSNFEKVSKMMRKKQAQLVQSVPGK
jgi:hypothetical protein